MEMAALPFPFCLHEVPREVIFPTFFLLILRFYNILQSDTVFLLLNVWTQLPLIWLPSQYLEMEYFEMEDSYHLKELIRLKKMLRKEMIYFRL